MIKIGLLGCGAIGKSLAEAIDNNNAGDAELVAIFDEYPDTMHNILNNVKHKPKEYDNFAVFIDKSGAELIVEAASKEAVELYAEKILESRKDLMIMSVGALMDNNLLERIMKTAKKCKKHVFIPSGAIGGIDVVKAAKIGGLTKVTLTTRKNPVALRYSPLFQKATMGKEVKKELVIFEGYANEAVKAFPLNVNVSATLSLAGLGGEKTFVRVIADPSITNNIHEIETEGVFGKMMIRLENITHPSNPKTSYLAVLSAIETLRSISNTNMKIGT